MTNVEFINTEHPDVLELTGVHQKYGDTVVIENLSLLVESRPNRGKCVAILGASGCGKSTILRFLSGLQKPTSGTIKIKGVDRNDDHRIGMVFQQYSSLPWLTVRENVEIGLRFAGISARDRKQKALEMIEIVGLSGHENKFAQYPTLSGGQLQRVAIARSLVTNPEILLMDEPFGALDTHTRLSMQDFIINIWEKFHNTILFVTHDIHEAVYISDEIWLMSANPGKIVDRINVESILPEERKRDLKRTKKFVEMVYDIEDRMEKISKKGK